MHDEAKQPSVLIVDDQPENIRVLAATLKGKYRQMAATGGAKALEIAASDNAPNLILLDVMMPDVDGYEVCRRLKADPRTRDIPVIFITAMSEVEDETKGFELGAVDYITKPFNPAIVEARVRTHLELREKTEIIRREREELQEAYRKLSQALAKLQQDIQMAAEVQSAMMPAQGNRPFPEAVAISTRYEPEMYVGGDFFDFQQLDDRRLGVILADVAGHGLQAAFVTGLIKTSFQLSGDDRLRPELFLGTLNATLSDLTPPGSFATVIYCVYDVGDRTLRYANAGHYPHPLLITHDGRVDRISGESSVVLGIMAPADFRAETFTMNPGDKLLLTTDGLVEARREDDEQFGMERLLAAVRAHASAPPDALHDALFEALRAFTGGAPQSDDIAALTVEFL